jgi:Zn-dependent metalloprotease
MSAQGVGVAIDGVSEGRERVSDYPHDCPHANECTRDDESTPVEITERSAGKGRGGSIRFEQVIRGVRYIGRNEIFVDEYGRVSEVLLKTVDPQRAPAQAPMPRAQALQVAIRALEEHLGKQDLEMEVGSEELRYYTQPGKEVLALRYRFTICPPTMVDYYVFVDAFSGETNVQLAAVL